MRLILSAAVAASALGFAGAGLAQPAPIVVVENISIDFGFGALRIPRLEAIGANMDADELRAALTGRDGAPIHERLRKLEAAALSAPAIELEQSFAGSRQTTTYRQAHIEGVRNGRIERMFSAAGAISGATEGEPYTGAHGPSVIEGVEFADVLRILATGGTQGEKPATVYARFWMSEYRMEMPKFDLEMRDLTGGA
ncbi:MAG: hypothetical protein JNK46_01840, partial [Methylobacteriaceae bacterium]|nr:hypothetical protein [Methylobacteriaceae bacterium]